MLRHTTTLGVREISCRRISLARSSEQIETAFGKITVKTSEGFGVRRQKPEYDEIAAAAEAAGVPFEEAAAPLTRRWIGRCIKSGRPGRRCVFLHQPPRAPPDGSP